LNITLDQLISGFHAMQKAIENLPQSRKLEKMKNEWRSDFALFYSPGRVISDKEWVAIRPLLVFYLNELANEKEKIIVREAIKYSHAAESRLKSLNARVAIQEAETKLNRSLVEMTESFTQYLKVKIQNQDRRKIVLEAYFMLFNKLLDLIVKSKVCDKSLQVNDVEVRHLN
jgi:hypothetical protein